VRWTIGGLQMMRGQYWRSGLKLKQRLAYISMTGASFSALRGLVLVSMMPVLVFTGTIPVHYSAMANIVIWAMPVATIGTSLAFGRKSYRFFRNEVYGVITLYAGLAALPALFGTSPRFQVTNKGRVSGSSFMRGPVFFMSALFACNIAAVIYGVARLSGLLPGSSLPPLTFGAWLWSIVLSAVFGYCVFYVRTHGNRAWGGVRGDWPAVVSIEGTELDATIERLGTGRLRLRSNASLANEGQIHVEIPSLGFTLEGEISGSMNDNGVRVTFVELQTQSVPLAQWVGAEIFRQTKYVSSHTTTVT
jgi:hypothetical protein